MFNRTEFLDALSEWCAGKFEPKVGFPSRRGFGNVAYLYTDTDVDDIEQGNLMQFVQKKLGMPVMIFIEPLDHLKEPALTPKEWSTYNE